MPKIRFDGQGVVITGAGRGLGAAYARLIAALGGAVVVHDAGVAGDGSGFDPSIADADAVVAEIVASRGRARRRGEGRLVFATARGDPA